MGSGTTAMVAKELGRYYIGCELHEEYGNLIKNRIGEVRGNIRKTSYKQGVLPKVFL